MEIKSTVVYINIFSLAREKTEIWEKHCFQYGSFNYVGII